MPLPPPPPLQTRVAVPKRLQPRLSQKRPMEVPTLAPLKALKVNPGSITHLVAEAQAALQRGAVSARADPVSARADPKEPATQGGAAKAALMQTGEGALPPHEGEAREPDEGEVLSVAEATEVEAPRVSEAKAMEAEAPWIAEAAAAGAGALATSEAMMTEAGAPGTTEANVIAARLLAQEVEMKAAEASVAPLGQGPSSSREGAQKVEVHLISSDDTSRAQEVVDAEVAGAVAQPSYDDPKGEPLFALEDTAEGERWDTFEQYCQLAEQSLRTALSVVADDLPELQRQKGLLAGVNKLLVARSAEVEDLRLRCANAKVKAAMAQEKVAPLAAWVKELEEELTRVADERDAFRSQAGEATASGKVLVGQLGAE
ncbi:uncharacterized protein [Miscanthus floridulus]|uniref:uncharacterized protein n=1 Tax=Miscanthus floridulus TaxID=154761 RepID=UPI003457635C